MSEPDLSVQLIKILSRQYGCKAIWLEKRETTGDKVEPEISGVFLGHPVFFEVKPCNPETRQNDHPFSKAQIQELAVREKAGAFAVGLLIMDLNGYEGYLKSPAPLDVDCGVRYVPLRDIPENGIVQYDGLTNLDLLKGGLFKRCIGTSDGGQCTKDHC